MLFSWTLSKWHESVTGATRQLIAIVAHKVSITCTVTAIQKQYSKDILLSYPQLSNSSLFLAVTMRTIMQ